jgi:hypothetical protein
LAPGGADALGFSDVFSREMTSALTLTPTTASKTLTKYGDSFTFGGTATSGGQPVRGVKVVLEASSIETGTYTSTGSFVITGANGTFSFTRKPTSKTYYRATVIDEAWYVDATSTQTVYALPRAKLGTPKMPTTMYVNKGKAVSGTIYPSHSSGYVKIQRYRYSSTKKKYLAYKDPISASFKGTSYSKSIKLPYKGRWKVRVWHADAGHAKSWSPMPTKYITVK